MIAVRTDPQDPRRRIIAVTDNAGQLVDRMSFGTGGGWDAIWAPLGNFLSRHAAYSILLTTMRQRDMLPFLKSKPFVRGLLEGNINLNIEDTVAAEQVASEMLVEMITGPSKQPDQNRKR